MTYLILFGSIGSDLAKNASDTATTFGLDLPHFIAQVISFSIVAGLLFKFAYKPILTVLEERRQRIADGLANADKIKTELARALRQGRLLFWSNDLGLGVPLVAESHVAAWTPLVIEWTW